MKISDILTADYLLEGKRKRHKKTRLPNLFSKRARGGFGMFYGAPYYGWGGTHAPTDGLDSGGGDGGGGGNGGGGGE